MYLFTCCSCFLRLTRKEICAKDQHQQRRFTRSSARTGPPQGTLPLSQGTARHSSPVSPFEPLGHAPPLFVVPIARSPIHSHCDFSTFVRKTIATTSCPRRHDDLEADKRNSQSSSLYHNSLPNKRNSQVSARSAPLLLPVLQLAVHFARILFFGCGYSWTGDKRDATGPGLDAIVSAFLAFAVAFLAWTRRREEDGTRRSSAVSGYHRTTAARSGVPWAVTGGEGGGVRQRPRRNKSADLLSPYVQSTADWSSTISVPTLPDEFKRETVHTSANMATEANATETAQLTREKLEGESGT
ncbi:uncharacterized protein SPSK_09659 [Sporothrix schenckii 1099-18]|uniref:Uncharacterized protein n=1 Tax=Sporothrix schenckii 1099-18 TaxID=1397361 RepID=A0A0F2MAQ3_SPOSC|nr:uncharacterized protein SPSK_09659 [Sporothrix schenckii 1099-18]KJR85905.1 hypothetical protein SPSK_09659 [Sporothrix schenckii 1099-18]